MVISELFEAKGGVFSGFADYQSAISYTGAATLGGAQPLDGGLRVLPITSNAELEPRITLSANGPYPFTLLSLSTELDLTEA